MADSPGYDSVPAERPRAASRDAKLPATENSLTGEAWRGELAHRLAAYRVRRKRLTPNKAQSQLPFSEDTVLPSAASVAVADAAPPHEEDFSFTIAIGRLANKNGEDDGRMMIDVSSAPPSVPSSSRFAPAEPRTDRETDSDHYAIATLGERLFAGAVDVACLFFAYGGFLALFGSLGGQFTLSKLSAAVYVTTFAIVYLQYFAMFTMFGGTTPGMMLRGLQVVNSSGDAPTQRQMLLRSAGYLLSAGTLFLGFLWAIWDEDGLTWHDRMSGTHLNAAPTYADIEAQPASHSH
ncbi:MAG: hypothetical protein NVS9B4_23920 [Candidatus Acidiferrum sp.]